jgi:hypothetical protein
MREDERIVTLAWFETEMEASIARGALEAIGIEALVPWEHRGGGYSGGMTWGPGELKVFESDRERALAEIRRLQMHVVRPDDTST